MFSNLFKLKYGHMLHTMLKNFTLNYPSNTLATRNTYRNRPSLSYHKLSLLLNGFVDFTISIRPLVKLHLVTFLSLASSSAQALSLSMQSFLLSISTLTKGAIPVHVFCTYPFVIISVCNLLHSFSCLSSVLPSPIFISFPF